MLSAPNPVPKGEAVNLMNCDQEPVHTPGNIQPFGAVVVFKKGRVVQASANLGRWLRMDTEAALDRSIAELLSQEASDEINRLVASGRIQDNPMHVWSIPEEADRPQVWLTAHTHADLLIIEIEPHDAGEIPGGEYAALKHSLARLDGDLGLQEYCRRLADEVSRLTGFDRVMVYQFKSDLSGEVIAETVRDGLPKYFGLNYPAADIPAPARAMYRKMWVRALPDIRAPSVPLVPAEIEGKPTDLSYTVLRGVSPIHVEYLTNMGVVATMSLSLMKEGELWGLVACHHYQSHRLSIQIRSACEIMAQVASLQLAAAEVRDEEEFRQQAQDIHQTMVARASREGASLSTLVEDHPGLLQLIPCSGAAIRIQGKWSIAGITPTDVELEELSHWLVNHQRDQELFATESLSSEYPPAVDWNSIASGLLAVRFSLTRHDVMMWFRPETAQTVQWAGDPHDKPVSYGPHGPRLHPRKSFEVWRESVRGRSLRWTPAQRDIVRRLRLSVLEIIVSHGEILAKLNRQLEASNSELDSFAYVASHDLKEPLRGIFNNTQSLLDATEGISTNLRYRAENVLRLTQRMEGLIESLLHYSRVGRLDLSMHDVDLNEVVEEALDMLSYRRDETEIEIRIPQRLPTIYCDHVRIRELYLNLISNAMKYNTRASKWIEIGYRDDDTGARDRQTVFYVRDNGIGIKPKFHEQVFTIFKRLHGRNDFGGGSGAGLTIARRIVERHGGCIWLESVPDEGTTFFFTLPGDTGAT